MVPFQAWIADLSVNEPKFKPLADALGTTTSAIPKKARKRYYTTFIASSGAANKDTLTALLDEAWNRWTASSEASSDDGGLLGWLGAHAAGVATAAVTITVLLVLLSATLATLMSSDFTRTESARWLITFLFAVGTIGIAIVIVLDNFISDDEEEEREKRFARGKDILTILIGVLGTIIGFYFGSDPDASSSIPIQASAIELPSEEIPARGQVTVGSLITGGTPPYTYSISFVAEDGTVVGAGTSQITNASSYNGLIFDTIVSPDISQKTSLKVRLDVVDGAGKTARSEHQVMVNPAK